MSMSDGTGRISFNLVGANFVFIRSPYYLLGIPLDDVFTS
jgi:hypothetical protein